MLGIVNASAAKVTTHMMREVLVINSCMMMDR